MIDFRNTKRRIKKFEVEEGEFFLRDISSKEGKEISKKAGKKDDQQLAAFLKALMCDEKGELLNLTDDELTEIGIGLMQDVVKAVSAVIHGEKKS